MTRQSSQLSMSGDDQGIEEITIIKYARRCAHRRFNPLPSSSPGELLRFLQV